MRDLPHRWFEAIRMALIFIGFEEMPEDERPPRSIWLEEEALGSWFQRVKEERERKYGTDKGKGNNDTLLEGESVQNKAARSLVAGG